jgi:hypothetical protein
MAADFIIHPKERVVFSYGWGTLTAADLREHRSRLFEHPRFDPRLRQLANLMDVAEMKLSSNQIWSLACEPVLGPRSRRAVVATDRQYGWARMFHGYSEGQNVGVFRRLDEAAAWLDLPIELALKAFDEIRRMHGLR